MSNFEDDLQLIRKYFNNSVITDKNNLIIQSVIKALSIHDLAEMFANKEEFSKHNDKLKDVLKKQMNDGMICIETQDLILSFLDLDIANELYDKYNIIKKKEN